MSTDLVVWPRMHRWLERAARARGWDLDDLIHVVEVANRLHTRESHRLHCEVCERRVSDGYRDRHEVPFTEGDYGVICLDCLATEIGDNYRNYCGTAAEGGRRGGQED